MASLTSVSVELLLLLCIVWSCLFVLHCMKSLDEQTKYNPYPGIHSFVDYKHLACSIRETLYSTFILCSFTAVCNPGDIAKKSTCGRGITADKR